MYLAVPVRFVFADAGFAGRLVDWATAILRTTLHIVRKPEGQQGFAVIPPPLGRGAHPGLADRPPPPGPRLQRHPAISEAMIRWAAIDTMTRRIARGRPATRQQR